jgi:hypothetical protein
MTIITNFTQDENLDIVAFNHARKTISTLIARRDAGLDTQDEFSYNFQRALPRFERAKAKILGAHKRYSDALEIARNEPEVDYALLEGLRDVVTRLDWVLADKAEFLVPVGRIRTSLYSACRDWSAEGYVVTAWGKKLVQIGLWADENGFSGVVCVGIGNHKTRNHSDAMSVLAELELILYALGVRIDLDLQDDTEPYAPDAPKMTADEPADDVEVVEVSADDVPAFGYDINVRNEIEDLDFPLEPIATLDGWGDGLYIYRVTKADGWGGISDAFGVYMVNGHGFCDLDVAHQSWEEIKALIARDALWSHHVRLV